jgi:molybdopterin/thiamine biosynthesis adenylyltransferase
VAAAGLSQQERERYLRQLPIPGWGEEVQQRLKEATVFVAGAGGLGSPLLMYLTAAGVGTLRVCDSGRVELSNLNRQLLYSQADVGRNKAETARKTLRRLNPHVRVQALARHIAADSVAELAGDAALIVDCLDNFPTRFTLNEHCVRTGTPLLHAGVTGLGGQIVLLHPPRTACLACLVAPPVEEPVAGEPPVPFPILGATAGVLGCLQAMEALKYLSGLGSLLEGRLLFCDGEAAAFHEVLLEKDPRCPVCRSSR